jgi:hypothetical protein
MFVTPADFSGTSAAFPAHGRERETTLADTE